jgi:integrase
MRNKLAVIAGEEEQQEQQGYQDPLSVFMYALKAAETRRQWPRRLKIFFDFLKLEEPIEQQAKQFLMKTKQDFQWAQHNLFRFMVFQQERVKQGKISEATVPNYYKAIKLFCEMNDIVFNWKKITRGMPRVRQAANDRAPTLEELRRLIEYPDRRIKPIVYTMVSSGIRIGAWDYLRWKNVNALTNDKGEITVAKLTVYAGDREEYYSFITPEAYTSLSEWMDFRASYGEKITGESWLMRDIWQTTNIDYGAKLGLATCPKRLKSSGIKRLLERALWEQGIRQPLREGTKRHEWKAAHGFRKFYKTRTEQVMKPANVEITMGHNIGVSKSYYKPTEREVMEDYLKAADLLTISNNNLILQKEVAELQQKSENNEYVIRGKLQEKDEEIKTIKEQFNNMQSQLQGLMSAIGHVSESDKKEIAKQLIENGMHKQSTDAVSVS